MTAFRKLVLIACFAFVAGPVAAQDLPATAKKASPEEFKAFADGKPVEVEILDLEKPVTATLTWNWGDETITGEAVIDGKKKVDVKVAMSVDGDKVCSKGRGEPTCYLVYIDSAAKKFYEVRDDGKVHAISTLKP